AWHRAQGSRGDRRRVTRAVGTGRHLAVPAQRRAGSGRNRRPSVRRVRRRRQLTRRTRRVTTASASSNRPSAMGDVPPVAANEPTGALLGRLGELGAGVGLGWAAAGDGDEAGDADAAWAAST